jgi:thioredoxin-related protein
MNRILFLVLFCLSAKINQTFAQAPIQWTNIKDAEALAAKTGKKIMVKTYTNWCGWCKTMDKSTFPDEHVTKVLNDNYISVQFNAEQKEDITWGGVPYKIVQSGSGSYHELAAKWLNNKLTYPTIVILDEKGVVIQAIPGYRKPFEFEQIIAYFAGNFHQKMDWGKFQEEYKH